MSGESEGINFDAIIIGAGGAGMMCALQAGRRGRRVLLLDHADEIGRKIMISGGGRCNFTNIHASAANYASSNKHYCKSALSRFTPADFISMVRQHRIAYHEKKLGQLFCDGSAKQIVRMLLDECESAAVEIRSGCRVRQVRQTDGAFTVDTSDGSVRAASLVVATGGLSIPKIGATGFGYELAKQFGLKIVPTNPALVGFDLSASDQSILTELSGVSFDSNATCNKVTFRENTLFTHTGLSGPAILQASLYWNSGDSLLLDTLPDCNAEEWLLGVKRTGARRELKNVLSDKLPARLAEKFCSLGVVSRPIADVSDKELRKLSAMLNSWTLQPARTFGYQKAEVTKGGVSTSDLSSQTMAAKNVPGLYFIGEVVDVTGWLGGYNFQWAWASGYVAGSSV